MDVLLYHERLTAIGRAFSPAAPITDHDLFAGRQKQLVNLGMVANQRGQHALIYGERGVGKTSLARVTQELHKRNAVISYYTCHSGDTYESIWKNVLREISLTSQLPSFGFGDNVRQVVHSVVELLDQDASPPAVARVLEMLSESMPVMVIVDEFDRPIDEQVRTLIADTIKILADAAVKATVILVGVADTVDELIAEHESILRPLVQVQMPRMTDEELRDVVRRGMKAAQMDVDDKFIFDVAELSQGFPHFTHLLAYQGALAALNADRTDVRHTDFRVALDAALEATSQTVRERYHRATFSNRETLHKQVLLACALADKDELGSFGAPDVRDRLREITHKNYEIPAFAAHLKDFSFSDARGPILKRIGTTRRFRYRFRDPLMPPFVVMKGRVDDLI